MHASSTTRDPEIEPALGIRLRWTYFVSRMLFALLYRVLGLRRSVIRTNVERSFPDMTPAQRRGIARDYSRRQSEIAAESWYGQRISEQELRERVTIRNPGLLAVGVPPRAVVLAGAHHCNWEWMSLRLSLEFPGQYLALYKPPHNAGVEARIVRMRTRFGARLVPAKSILKELAQFRQAAAIALLADQVPRSSPEKYWTTFLGQDTAFYMGPELLGRALRSQVLFVRMDRLWRGRYELELVPLNSPGDKPESGTITERYTTILERYIRDDPAGWLWSHRRWKLKRPAGVSGLSTS